MTHVWNIFLIPIFKIAKVKVIGAVHDFEPHPGENFPGRTAWLNAEARMMDGLICFSGHVRDGLVQRRVVEQEQIRLLPLPTFGYDGAVPRRAPRNRGVRLLFFGRILAYKGLTVLFEAVRILQYQGQNISLDEIIDYIVSEKFDLVGMQTYITNIIYIFRLSRNSLCFLQLPTKIYINNLFMTEFINS